MEKKGDATINTHTKYIENKNEAAEKFRQRRALLCFIESRRHQDDQLFFSLLFPNVLLVRPWVDKEAFCSQEHRSGLLDAAQEAL